MKSLKSLTAMVAMLTLSSFASAANNCAVLNDEVAENLSTIELMDASICQLQQLNSDLAAGLSYYDNRWDEQMSPLLSYSPSELLNKKRAFLEVVRILSIRISDITTVDASVSSQDGQLDIENSVAFTQSENMQRLDTLLEANSQFSLGIRRAQVGNATEAQISNLNQRVLNLMGAIRSAKYNE